MVGFIVDQYYSKKVKSPLLDGLFVFQDPFKNIKGIYCPNKRVIRLSSALTPRTK